VHNEEKARTWARKAVQFNACSEIRRDAEQLKKQYNNNNKKNLRKNAAEERKDMLLTGINIPIR
jgi:hypothetical protein